MMALLLVGLALIESGLYLAHRPLLSDQHGWRRAAVFACWVAFGAHLSAQPQRVVP